jgi:hypothetical protein
MKWFVTDMDPVNFFGSDQGIRSVVLVPKYSKEPVILVASVMSSVSMMPLITVISVISMMVVMTVISVT